MKFKKKLSSDSHNKTKDKVDSIEDRHFQVNSGGEVILTLDLFVRERRDWYEAVLGVESLVEPVKVFVSPRHLDVVKLNTRNEERSYSSNDVLHSASAGRRCSSSVP